MAGHLLIIGRSVVERSSIQIREITIADEKLFPAMLELLERTQGQKLFGKNYVPERAADPSSYVIVSTVGEDIAGVSVAQIIDNFDYYLPFNPDIVREFSGLRVGSFATACVRPDLQGRGIGRKMANARLDWLKAQKCEVVVGVSWVSGRQHSSDHVFEKTGFKAVARVEGFYRESSLKQKFICPTCGEPPCVCAAIFYKLQL